MTDIGRVISVVHLPAPADALAMTALRLQVQNKEHSVFVVDSPVAATLVVGEWVSFKQVRSDAPAYDVLRLNCDARLAKLGFPELTLEVMREVLTDLLGGIAGNVPEPEIFWSVSCLNIYREKFKCQELPTSAVLDIISPDIAKLLQPLRLGK